MAANGNGRARTALLSLALLLAAGRAEAAEPFRIGVIEDLNGTYSGNGGPNSVLATKMAVEDFGGTVQGAPIEILGADHQNKADIGSTVARQWFDTEQVDAIMDLTTS